MAENSRIRIFAEGLDSVLNAQTIKSTLEKFGEVTKVEIFPEFKTVLVSGTDLSPGKIEKSLKESGVTLISVVSLYRS